eukprot:CAMPEP_0197527926 /NCGR_PEP_ID=MMETSP1318-20131121/23262_1 /TAXON_ID=552666 /ORGANISM="Partenskyella glossopodia, Strain RCC365" /LENGTH=301 /DNA_ID=CAMNT_0043082799 /DNA_START=289 /DNA_END=1195 /DNA_ORIENTATION=-
MSQDTEIRAKARSSAVDRLASSALKKKKNKRKSKQEATPSLKSSGYVADSSSDPTVMTRRISEAKASLSAETKKLQRINNAINHISARLGEAHRIQWTIGNWNLRETSADGKFYAPVTIQDSSGRKWRAYARKAPGETRYDYDIGLFLECISKHHLPTQVAMCASLLHSHSKEPVTVPNVTTKGHTKASSRQFTSEERAWGFEALMGGGGSGCGGGSARLTGLGALDAKDDRVSFRMDFAVLDQVDVEKHHSDPEDPEEKKDTSCRSQKTRVPSVQRKAVDEQEEEDMEVALAVSLSEKKL